MARHGGRKKMKEVEHQMVGLEVVDVEKVMLKQEVPAQQEEVVRRAETAAEVVGRRFALQKRLETAAQQP